MNVRLSERDKHTENKKEGKELKNPHTAESMKAVC
jgi:hypothetical protein